MLVRLSKRMKLPCCYQTLTIDTIGMEEAGNYQSDATNPIGFCASEPLKLGVKYE